MPFGPCPATPTNAHWPSPIRTQSSLDQIFRHLFMQGGFDRTLELLLLGGVSRDRTLNLLLTGAETPSELIDHICSCEASVL
jgi:hypothetical protein